MILRAAWVLPINAPPIRGGVVRVEGGRIVAVGSAPHRLETGASVLESDDSGILHLGHVALLPGFVNAHAHLELTGYRAKLSPAPLWDWLNGLIVLRRQPDAAAAEIEAARRGAAMSLAAGVTCVGDISRSGRSFAGLFDSPIRKVCFCELISGAGDPPRDPDELRATTWDWLTRIGEREDAAVGVSPHAPYTVSWDDLRRVVALASEQDLPITMHFCETHEEREWLESRTGRLAEFLAQYPVFASMQMPQGPPMSVLHRAGMTRLRPLLAHCNYVTDEEIADLARSACSVAYCPRAHRFFGHASHRWRDMLAAGVNVCAATDSLASNDSLSVLDELRFLRREAPEVPPATLLEMGTIRAARALGLEDSIGSIRPGAWADLTAIPLEGAHDDDPPAAILDSGAQPTQTWVGGTVVRPRAT